MSKADNNEETAGKAVCHRPPDDQAASKAIVHAINPNETLSDLMPVRGVYRFNSHEEADQWLVDQRAAAMRRRNR